VLDLLFERGQIYCHLLSGLALDDEWYEEPDGFGLERNSPTAQAPTHPKNTWVPGSAVKQIALQPIGQRPTGAIQCDDYYPLSQRKPTWS